MTEIEIAVCDECGMVLDRGEDLSSKEREKMYCANCGVSEPVDFSIATVNRLGPRIGDYV